MGVSVGEKNKGSGIWYLFIRHESLTGGRICKRVPGSGEKARKLALNTKEKLDARIALEESLFPDEEKSTKTVSEFFADWQKGTMKSLAATTQESYQGLFEKYIQPAFGSVPINRITRKDVKNFIVNLKAIRYKRGGKKKQSQQPQKLYPLSKDTVRLIASTLRRMFNEAKDDELIESNPAEKQGKNFRELNSMAEIYPFDEDESKLFLETAWSETPFYFPLFVCLLHAGLRIGEAVALRWSDVDFKRKVLHVRHQGKDLGKTKTRKTRMVEISDFLFGVLKTLQKCRSEEWVEQVPEFVFCSQTGSVLDAHNLRYQQFSKILKKAKLAHRRLHDLRHTFATIHLQNNAPLQWVAKQLGHASVKMTVDVYYHYLPETNKGNYANSIPGIAEQSVDNVIVLNR